MAYEPIDILKVDVNRITLKAAKQDEKSKKMGRMFSIHHGDQRLELILPELNAPFGPKKLVEYAQENQLPKTTITLSFDGIDDPTSSRAARLRACHAKLKQIEQRIIDLIAADSQRYFVKDRAPVDANEVAKRLAPILWSPEMKGDVKYPDTLRVNLQLYNPTPKDKTDLSADEVNVLRRNYTSKPGYPLVIDKAKNEVKVNFDNVEEVLYKHCRVKIIANFSFIWITNANKASVNVSWVHGRIVSDPPKANLSLLDDDSDEDVPSPVKRVKLDEPDLPNDAEDSEDTEDSEDAEEAEE